ncbi:MAG TPA: exopolysaccharide biosynthesis polyprenyl glycosylphosphotransferase [Streptosporangiaceae bacterium]|jgi:exopolysaccharide biosynthesis polyprenyl glycosylphosphotransferase
MVNYFQEHRPAVPGQARTGRSPAGLPRTGRAEPTRPGCGPAGRGRLGLSRLVLVAALPIADSIGLATAGASMSAGLATVLYGLVVLTALWLGGLYRLRICLRVSDQASRILAATLLPVLAALPLLPAAAALRLGLISAGLVITFRLLASCGLRVAHRRGALTEATLVIGSGTFGAYLAEQVRRHPELGLRVSGFLDTGAPRRDLPEPSLGRPEDLAQVVAGLAIRRVIVCFGDWRDEDLVAILRACRRLRAQVCVVPRLHELGLAIPRGSLDEIWGIPLIPLRRIGESPASRGLKRAFDVTVATVMLAAALPVLLAATAAIALQTGQSPLFRQRRVTGDGREATVLKLRTIPDASDSDTRWTVDARRYSRLGGWLRATHLDELPQLVNVLRGEMSLVGPRPERPHFAEQFGREIPRYADRDRVRAGLTGWAQVHGLHGDTSITERSRFDNQYIEYWSPWLDTVILLRTVGSALSGLGGGR